MSNTRENTLAALAAAAFLGLLAGEAAVSGDGSALRGDRSAVDGVRAALSGDGFAVNSTERSQAPADDVAAVRLAHHHAELPACAR